MNSTERAYFIFAIIVSCAISIWVFRSVLEVLGNLSATIAGAL